MSITVAATQPPPPPKTTPLLEALKAEKSAHKDKEAILRNHAHYKELPSGSNASKKEDAKKKGITAPASKQAEHAQVGKKGPRKAALAQKGQPQSQGTVAAPTKTPGSSNSAPSAKIPSGTKASRSGREHQGRQQQMKAPAAASTATPPIQAVVGSEGTNSTTTTTTTAAAQPPATPTASRRARPVIGLASRQFEAALSGAGVGSTGERKPRREREGDKDKAGGSGGGNAAANGDKPSPRKDRGGRRKEDKAGGAGPGSSAGSQPPPARIPSILQRSEGASPTILQREGQLPVAVMRPTEVGSSSKEIVSGPAVGSVPRSDSAGGRGHARRGRGRGRGGAIRGGG